MFTHFRLNNRCQECPGSPVLILVMFVVLLLLALWMGYVLSRRNVNLAILAIFVDYFQARLFSSSSSSSSSFSFAFKLLSLGCKTLTSVLFFIYLFLHTNVIPQCACRCSP